MHTQFQVSHDTSVVTRSVATHSPASHRGPIPREQCVVPCTNTGDAPPPRRSSNSSCTGCRSTSRSVARWHTPPVMGPMHISKHSSSPVKCRRPWPPSRGQLSSTHFRHISHPLPEVRHWAWGRGGHWACYQGRDSAMLRHCTLRSRGKPQTAYEAYKRPDRTPNSQYACHFSGEGNAAGAVAAARRLLHGGAPPLCSATRTLCAATRTAHAQLRCRPLCCAGCYQVRAESGLLLCHQVGEWRAAGLADRPLHGSALPPH